MRARLLTLVLTVALAGLAGACSDDDDTDGTATAPNASAETTAGGASGETTVAGGAGDTTAPAGTATPPAADTTVPGGQPTDTEPPVTLAPAGSASEPAIADLAARLGVDPATITVVEARDVTWPDSSLGCPEPDMMYRQALTEGFLLVLEANGERYEYHSGPGSELAFCATPTPPVPE